MPDTTTTDTTTVQLPPLPTLTDAFCNPSQLVARRGEFVKLASDRAHHVAAAARTRLQTVGTVATARAQELRKSTDEFVTTALAGVRKATVPARVRSVVHTELQRAAQALQALAKRTEPKPQAPGEPLPTKPAE
jgi:hypothetical protein